MADVTINDVYAPLEQNLKDQAIANANRYAQNQADVKSITGVLSAIAPADKARINEQFTNSIQQQQEATAAATAKARLENAAGVQGAAAAANELGSGQMPVPTTSASGTAYQQQIDNANASQSNWGQFMTAMQNQQVGNAEAAQRGYGFEVANALQNLARNYGQQQTALDAQRAQLLSQKAQSQLSAQAAGAEMAQESALAEAKNQTALDVAKIAGNARIAGQQIAANARTGAAAISAAAKAAKQQKVTVNSPATWEKSLRVKNVNLVPGSAGVGAGLTLVKRSVAAIAADQQAQADAAAKAIGKTAKQVKADAIYNAWAKANSSLPTSTKNAVYEAIRKGYYKTWTTK